MRARNQKPAPTIASFEGEPNSYPLLAEGIQETMGRAKERIEVLTERINADISERDALSRLVNGAMYSLGQAMPPGTSSNSVGIGTYPGGTFHT